MNLIARGLFGGVLQGGTAEDICRRLTCKGCHVVADGIEGGLFQRAGCERKRRQ